MPRYLIQAPHTAEECTAALIELLDKGPLVLFQFDFACAVGDQSDHLGAAILELASESAARETVPASICDKAVITEVRKVTPEEVRLLKKK